MRGGAHSIAPRVLHRVRSHLQGLLPTAMPRFVLELVESTRECQVHQHEICLRLRVRQGSTGIQTQ